jgi:hypothetical protein
MKICPKNPDFIFYICNPDFIAQVAKPACRQAGW